MLQVFIKKGQALAETVPAPGAGDGCVLIRVVNSCISAGTEMSSVQGSGDSLLKRALKHPDKIAKAVQMARNEGISRTVEKVRGHLDAGMPTGYSISGSVLKVGRGVEGFAPGDRVAAAGAGLANHAEYVEVPKNLVVRIPDEVGFAQASTVTMGAIAMQSVRRADLKIGEYVAVVGTGILGILAVQILVNAGSRVIAVDIDDARLELAHNLGSELCINSGDEHFVRTIRHFTNGHGADTVLFCAATTDESVLSKAFAATRKKGRVVMVGTWGKELNRDDIYAKELDFLISTSYGPGRYDDAYEAKGHDYPYAYVRWTENRNMAEYIRLVAAKKINVDPLIQAEYPVEQAGEAFQALNSDERPLIVILGYPAADTVSVEDISRTEPADLSMAPAKATTSNRIRVALVGAGSFGAGVHLPNLRKLNKLYDIHAICNRTGASARNVATRFGARYATTDFRAVLDDEAVDLVMICTRHDLHGPMVLESLAAGKHTFVEKPLCTQKDAYKRIRTFFNGHEPSRLSGVKPVLMVGFNRRFSAYATEIKKQVHRRINPLFLHYRMNAGYIPLDHWVHTDEGGGRIIGEACHILDLFSYLVGSKAVSASAASLGPTTGSVSGDDNKAITVEYEDGSVAILEYFSIGSEHLPKERLEVHFDQKTLVMENFTSLRGYGLKVAKISSTHPEKGQLQEVRELANTILGNSTSLPISLESIFETTDLCFRLSGREGW